MAKKFDQKKMDLDNLDAIIRNCESHMVGRFKKKPEDDGEMAVVEVEGDEDGEKPDLEDADLDDLMRLYEEIKDRKEA